MNLRAAAAAALTLAAAPVFAQHHNYVMQDGLEYGYAAALSPEQQQSGMVTPKIITFMYLGSRDGKYQLLGKSGNVVSVLECAMPCQYVKAMTFVDADYFRDSIQVERFAAVPDSLVAAAFQDATSGQLHVAGTVRSGHKYSMWMDATKGLEFIKAEEK